MVKSRRSNSHSTSNSGSILSLPHDLIASVLASLASSSLTDLFRAKFTCKELNKAAQDHVVYNRVSLENFPTVYWKSSTQALAFLNQCEANGNPDGLFQKGLVEYFNKKDSETGLGLLKKAADLGHADAAYVLAIILYTQEGSKSQALNLFQKISTKGRKDIKKCRKRSKKILHGMWINNRINPPQNSSHDNTCEDPKCGNGGLMGLPSKKQWSLAGGNFEYKFCSDSCQWKYETRVFSTIVLGA